MRTPLLLRAASLLFLTPIALTLLGGCASESASNVKPTLQSGYSALDQKQYDQAVGSADQALQQSNGGAGAAEALYLRGRAIYGRTKLDAAHQSADLREARDNYTRALAAEPPPPPALEGLIRCDLANVAYFQDDYATADREWQAAFDKLDSDETKAWTLYRVGICRQRMGRWSEADSVFAAVQSHYPNSTPAQRSRDHMGAKGFYVQVGTFRDTSSADTVIASLKSRGLAATKSPRPASNAQAVMVGPQSTYATAVALKQQLSPTYADAMIVP